MKRSTVSPARARELLGRYADVYRRLRAARSELGELSARAQERAREIDLVGFGLREIEAVDPQPGEDAALADEEERLAHADGLRAAARAAHGALAGDPMSAGRGGPAAVDGVRIDTAGIDAMGIDAVALVAAARRAIGGARQHDPALAELADRIAEVGYVLSDVATELASRPPAANCPVMLAVEVVLAAAGPVPTLVFDEVDTGVGGKAAVEVGRRLARLARTAQVVVVTHLPQLAAFADRHLEVAKSSAGAVTTTGVRVLDRAGRVRELSRMLAGLEDSPSARAHAEELVAAACALKAETT